MNQYDEKEEKEILDLVMEASAASFQEWDNEVDEIYNDLCKEDE